MSPSTRGRYRKLNAAFAHPACQTLSEMEGDREPVALFSASTRNDPLFRSNLGGGCGGTHDHGPGDPLSSLQTILRAWCRSRHPSHQYPHLSGSHARPGTFAGYRTRYGIPHVFPAAESTDHHSCSISDDVHDGATLALDNRDPPSMDSKSDYSLV